MNYEEFIDYEISYLPFGNPPLIPDDLLNFEHSERKRELLQSANFYSEAIQHNSYYLTVPCRLLFVADYSVNAKAVVFGQRGVIIWYAGLLLEQMQILDNYQQIDDALNGSGIQTILHYLDNHPSILFYQFTQHFTFYHEFAHILQLQGTREAASFLEKMDGDYTYDLVRHLLEVDADEFAALCLATHIFQYSHAICGEKISEEKLRALIAFFCVPVLISFLRLYPDDIANINLETGTHPHPLFRILFISIVVSEFAKQVYDAYNINYNDIIDKALEVVDKITGFNLINIWAVYYEDLTSYFKLIRANPLPAQYESAVTAWNSTRG